MLDGPGVELPTSPVTLRSQSDRVSFEPQSDQVAFDPRPDKVNFSPLPADITKGEGVQRAEGRPSAEEVALIEQIMKQGSQKKTEDEVPKPVNQPEIKQPIQKTETAVQVSAKNENVSFSENVKIIFEKVKSFFKKAWYYVSGSFIWDKIF